MSAIGDQSSAVYRRLVCQRLASLRETDSNDLIGALEQTLGRRALEEEEVGRTGYPLKLPTGSNLDGAVPSSFVHCHVCGGWLVPGENGTTVRLRSVGRGRTRRRRASRQQQKMRAKSNSKSRSGGGHKADNHGGGDSSHSQHVRDPLSRLRRVRNGTCRNTIVYECGLCQTKHRLKGLPPKRPTKGSTTPKAEGKNLRGPRKPGNSTKTRKPSPSHEPAPRAALPSKKKQKKKKGTAKSGLLDFLSTLND